MTFIHGYPQEVQTFPFLSTYLHIWGHSCPTAYISENSCNSWHHSCALHGRKSLKQQPAPKREITTVYAQLNCELTTREPDSPKITANVDVDACFRREGRKKKKAYSRNPGLCLCSAWGPNWIWAWIPANSQALSKETGWDPFNISSLAWRRHDERKKRRTQSGRGSKLQMCENYPKFTPQRFLMSTSPRASNAARLRRGRPLSRATFPQTTHLNGDPFANERVKYELFATIKAVLTGI